MKLTTGRMRRRLAIAAVIALTVTGTAVVTSPAHADPLSPLTGARVATSGTPTAPSGSVVYYVDAVAGNDSNTGTSTAQAWKTLAKVDSASFAPGDVIAFKRGQTFSGSATITSAGTLTSPILITAYGSGAQPLLTNPGGWNMLVLAAANIQVKNLAFTNGVVFDNADGLGIRGPKYELSGAIAVTTAGAGVLIQDNTFTDVGVGVKTYGPSTLIEHNTFRDLRIAFRGFDSGSETSYGALGVSLNNSGIEVRYNDFINCRSTDSPYGADGGAIEIEGFAHAKDDILIHHNYSRGSQGFVEVTETTSSNVSIYQNVSDDYQQFIAWDSTTDPTGYLVENNTVVRRHSAQVSYLIDWWFYREIVATPADDWALIRNNIFYSPLAPTFGAYAFPHDHNLHYGFSDPINASLGNGDIVAPPQFVDLATGDLRLAATSPAIDNGTTAASSTDLWGNATGVGLGHDIGAHEASAGGSGAANLVVDGGFESQTTVTSTSSPWRGEAGASSAYGIDVAAGKARSGSDNGWVANGGGTEWAALKQTVTVQPSSTYRLTVWVRSSAGIDHAWLGVKSTGGSAISEIRHGSSVGSYSRYVLTFTTGSNTSVVVHSGYWAPGSAAWQQIDDVALQKL